MARYPLTMVTYHTTGATKDTFFSPKMLEEMILAPTKHSSTTSSRRRHLQLHSCGNIKRFIPYMIDTGVDFMQVQGASSIFPQ